MTSLVPTKPERRLKIAAVAKSPWTYSVLALLLVALLDRADFITVFSISANALMGTVPYIILAVALVSYLKAAGAEAMIARAFEGQEVRMIFLAALFGGLAPFCSCEVIPFIAGLLAMGTPLSAIMAFWLSSPLIDPPTLLITASALGWPFAIAKAVAAVGLGLLGGFAIKLAMSGGLLASPLRPQTKAGGCGCSCGPDPFSGRPVWKVWASSERRGRFGEEARVNGLFLLKWLTLAYVLEGLMIHYVPASLIAGIVGGDDLGSIGLAALVGMPAYLNSYVAPPLVASLMEQGMSAGAGMAFIVAGAVSCVPAMAAVWSLVRPQVFAAYVGLGLLGAVIAGFVFQALVVTGFG